VRTTIAVHGARVHNLKNVSLEIPRDKLVIVTGVSGSGKSSLAFDTIYAEGQRRYMESLSSYARRSIEQVKKPDVDFMFGLSPVIAIEQRTVGQQSSLDRRDVDRHRQLHQLALFDSGHSALPVL
jgi:excinuclease ABC subunit A